MTEPVMNNALVASQDQFNTLALRLGFSTADQAGIFQTNERIHPALASYYIVEQFGAWQKRKEVNDEPHADASAKLQGLPIEVQQSISRMAEMRLVLLKTCLSRAGLSVYLELGQELENTLQTNFNGDVQRFLAEFKTELEEKQKRGAPLTLNFLEEGFGKRLLSIADQTSNTFSSYSDVLLRLHHGLWHANLDKPHEFAFKMDNLPTAPVVNEEDPSKSRPYGLRAFSDQANLLGIIGQMIALAKCLKQINDVGFMQPTEDTQLESLLKVHGTGMILNLDNGAIINN